MQSNYSSISRQQEQEESISFKDIFSLCLARWRWFVLSLVCCIAIAGLHLMRTTPVFERTSTILIKEDKGGNSAFSSVSSSFSNLGFFGSTSNVYNELGAISSPAVIMETARRLKLEYNYAEKGFFRNQVLYGTNLPYTVDIPGIGDNVGCSFRMDIAPSGRYTLSDFVFKGEEIKHTVVEGMVGDTLSTPVGLLVVENNPFYKSSHSEGSDEIRTILVSHSGMVGIVRSCTGKLNAEMPDKYADLIDLTYRDASIQRAEDFLNTLVAVYNETWVRDKNQIAVSTSIFIDERLRVIERELGEVDSDITAFRSENLITDAQAAASMYMTQANDINNSILELNNELYMAQYVRAYVANEQNKGQLLPVGGGSSSGSNEQILEYNKTLLQRNSLLSNTSASNPLIVELDKNLDALREAILVSMNHEIEALEVQINTLRQNEEASNTRIATAPQQSQYLLSTERQQKVKESLYLYLLQKREENELSKAFTAYNTRIITPPFGGFAPTSPSRKRVLMLAILIGLAIPLCIILVREGMNTKVRGRKDLEGSSIPFLGEIPYCKDEFDRGLKYHLTRYFSKEDRDRKRIVVKEGKRDVINEAFRVLRTNMEFVMGGDKTHNVVMFTSFNAHSGKSFLSMNTAIAFAIKKKKVLLIDGDMRHCSVSSYVDSPGKGLSDYLSGHIDSVDDIIVQVERYEYLHVLPVGTVPPNPAELLFSERLEPLITSLKQSYDYVLIDCPPAEVVADAQIIEKVSDRTIFIVRAGLFERAMLDDLENLYKDRKFKNMTLILNGTVSASGRYGSGYSYRYGYGYGYGYGYQYGASSSSHHHHRGGGVDKAGWKTE